MERPQGVQLHAVNGKGASTHPSFVDPAGNLYSAGVNPSDRLRFMKWNPSPGKNRDRGPNLLILLAFAMGALLIHLLPVGKLARL